MKSEPERTYPTGSRYGRREVNVSRMVNIREKGLCVVMARKWGSVRDENA